MLGDGSAHEEQVRRAGRLYQRGMSLDEIATELGTSQRTVLARSSSARRGLEAVCDEFLSGHPAERAVPRERAQKAVGVGSVAFGAMAALTPRLFLGMCGVPDEANVRTMTRLWGTRTAVPGALVFTVEGTENIQRMMTMTAAMNAADAVMVAAAGGVPVRARVLGSLTSAGLPALSRTR